MSWKETLERTSQNNSSLKYLNEGSLLIFYLDRYFAYVDDDNAFSVVKPPQIDKFTTPLHLIKPLSLDTLRDKNDSSAPFKSKSEGFEEIECR